MAKSDCSTSGGADNVLEPLSPQNPRKTKPTLRAVLAYNRCEKLSAALFYSMIVFAPWAFGTTQSWSIWTMNAAGYVLGGLLATKLAIRYWFGHGHSCWRKPASALWLTKVLAVLTVAILGYVLTAVLNARAVYNPNRMDFTFLSHIGWLPHSYDRAKTWQAFATYLALACFFWSVHDWLQGKSEQEIRASRNEAQPGDENQMLPDRLRRLLWVLCINGALLAGEAIVQRLDGGGKLLWLVEPRINKDALSQLGPYAYRANGAQYFNLLWPVAIGFWWMLRREARRRREAQSKRRDAIAHLLLPAVVLMAACPIISASRAAAIVAAGGLFVSAILIVGGLRRRHPAIKFAGVLFFGVVLSTGLYLGWEPLAARLKDTETGYFSREEIYDTARGISRDYPLFGTGPGSCESVFQLYRSSTEEYWPVPLHNDWLETLVTFGWVGSALIALAFGCVLGRWFLPGQIQTRWRFAAFFWLALAGCLAHARFDFPLQVYSVLHLFLLECAILFSISRPSQVSSA